MFLRWSFLRLTFGTIAFGQTRPIVYFIMAVSSMGKTTQGEKLAALLKAPFYEPDDFHTDASKAKMAKGLALTDDDRWPWLDRLRTEVIDKHLKAGTVAVMACSALKREYRKRLGLRDPRIRLIYLKGTLEMALANNRKRKDHFAGEQTVRSNFKILEEPLPDENAVVVMVDPTNTQRTFEHMTDALALTEWHTKK